MAQGRFANAEMVEPALAARVKRLKTKFLKAGTGAETDPAVEAYYARCRELFSAEGLENCIPQDLKDFVSTPIGANIGNTSMFSRAWKRLGEDVAADRTRASISYLLRGPDAVPLEDRLTHLIEDHAGTGMPGFKEAVLTKVLCIMEPDRFLPILTYATEETGKADLTRAVYGLHLPKVDLTSMQIGRLAVWSNDLLLELAGDGIHRAAARGRVHLVGQGPRRAHRAGLGPLRPRRPPSRPPGRRQPGTRSTGRACARSMNQSPSWMSVTAHG